jgi:dihydrofolate reductase/thymidylate synthase
MNTELILAIDKNFGIGYKNMLPWNVKDELRLFRTKTLNSTVIVGSKTFINLPYLDKRNVICLSKKTDIKALNFYKLFSKNPESIIVNSLEEADEKVKTEKVFVIGGYEIYKLALSIPNYINKIHLSILNNVYECDTFFDKKLIRDFIITEQTSYEEFTHYVLERDGSKGEIQYLNLLENILTNGVLSPGRNGNTISTFVNHLSFDLRNGFPLLSTKKMFIRGIIEELLFFLRGDTDTKILEEKDVNIWKGNTSKEFIESRKLPYAEGVMGQLYGYQWRFFNAPYKLDSEGRPFKPEGGVDQLANVIKLIKEDPKSRRILLTSFNPEQSETGVLYPCHSIICQFYVEGEYLDMFCYNRSSDMFLGVPFNIASSSLFLMIIGKLTNKTPRYFNLTLGDSHIYQQHLDAVKEQLNRLPYRLPNIILPDINTLEDIEKLESKNFILINYKSHSSIKADMIP